MGQKLLKRLHLRAPLDSDVLYEDGDYAFKARTLNISEGGVLLTKLPHVPEIRAIPLMMGLPQFPVLGTLPIQKVLELDGEKLPREMIRLRARMVRQLENMTDVDKIFVTLIGCEFVGNDKETIDSIRNYVERYAKNTIYLLTLFESRGNKGGDQLQLVRHVAQLMGYDSTQKIALLRQKILHDYQSLESL